MIPIGLEAGDLFSLAETAASLRPHALLLSRDVYAFDPEEFDALALSIGAQRLLVEDGEPVERLADRLREALATVVASEPPTSAGTTKPRRSSGIRWRVQAPAVRKTRTTRRRRS